MQNDTWRPQLKTGLSRRRTKLRLVFSVLVAGLFVLLIYLLLQPFWFPKTQFAVAITQPTSISGIRPSRIALNDVAYFSLSNSPEDHSNKIPQLVLSNLNYPADADRFEKSIQSLRMRAADVFILYVSGYGMTADGHTYLLCDNFDPSDTDLGKFPLRDLLQQLASCRAQTKLLILDVAQITYDPRLGVVSNVFPEVLSREVTNINHPNLWVLTSNSVLESSHVDPSSGRSIFAHFVIQGLQGEADLNENQSVDVDELYHFVSANVFNWVQRYTNGHATQTPQVIRSGKIFLPSSKSPKLISVITKEFDNEAETDETTENAAVSNLKNNQQIAASTGFSVPSKDMMSTKVLSRSIPKDLAKDPNKKADRQATEDKTPKDDWFLYFFNYRDQDLDRPC